MFKGILPSHKRVASSDFTMVTSMADSSANGKENKPEGNQGYLVPSKGRPPLVNAKSYGQATEKDKKRRPDKKNTVEPETHPAELNQAFEKLLDDLQIPCNLRPKLNGMDATVKAAMLKSSHIVKPAPSVSPPTTPRTSTLRRTQRSDSISSPRRPDLAMDNEPLQPPKPNFVYGSAYADPGSPRGTHSRGSSFDISRHFSRSQVNLAASSSLDLSGPQGSRKDKGPNKNLSPAKFFNILSGTSTTQIEVETIKKLRLLLRNESANWSQEFLSLGGYNALLTRLNEILEVEWREEQHDDQVLHELLRCLKALSTSAIGCFALRSSCPTPFIQLISLIYSDKKPGDIATRQLIVDLLLILFDLYPPSSLPAMSGSPRCEAWDSTSNLTQSNLITLPAPHRNLFSLIRALLLTPAPPPSESPATPVSPHAFIENLHKPRIYKTYLQELSDVCRDYFWVFCHPNNTIWLLQEVDGGKVEKPRAPGGMTGGVEFEAMGYFTTHLRLINAISKSVEDLNLPRDHEHSAYRFHMDMFLSGIERIIAISRKASTVYYPTLHLELSRYIAFVGRSGFELPWTITRLIGLPPTGLCKNPQVGVNGPNGSGRDTPTTPMRRGTSGISPPLRSPSRLEHAKID